MRKIDALLDEYGESHQDSTNKAIHWICVPVIVWAVVALLWSIPFPFDLGSGIVPLNWAVVALILAHIGRSQSRKAEEPTAKHKRAAIFFGLGKVPALFATIIYAVPPVIRLTNVGIREVSPSVIEAAHAFGSSYWQILFKVQLPLARPTIMVGVNQTTMMALAMVVIASMIGAKGLGFEVLLAINRIEIGRGFEAGLCIVFMAIIIDRLTYAMATRKKN